ncbi:acyltransferase family protein [Enterobacter soli]|uniref:Acyltransferase n=1 Tax=Enterobacter soli TaxID=885040 RepID=A0AAW8HAC4_9ENTR|nr:acyltransferase [Enterobacter soli]MDQ2256409.1 acyltransferase [Enterobacter soli]MDQ2339057.1 acyltransferase [Enterobacter soli]
MRNYALDAAKFLACFFIVFVHAGSYSELGALWGETLRVTTRWAVPFFFLASGFTIGNSDAGGILKRVNKLISILFYGSVIYIPMLFYKSDDPYIKTLNKIFSPDTIHYGLYGHLWFIGSLMAGLVLFWYARSNLSHRQSLLLSCFIIFMCWFSDAIKSFGVQIWFFYLFRYLIGFALVYIGWSIGAGKISFTKSNKLLSMIFIVCLLAMGAEYFVSFSYFDGTHGERQFPLACIPAAIVLLFICVNSKTQRSTLSNAGEAYSLGIYIIHPLIIYIIGQVSGFYRINIYSSVMLLLGFSLSLVILIIINKSIPYTYNKLNGIGIK